MKPPADPLRADAPLPSSVELVLRAHARLIEGVQASPLALEAAVAAMAPATRAAITADLKCFLGWCARHKAVAVPATPETLVHYLLWLKKGAPSRRAAKPSTLTRRIASIARVHRILGFGEKEPLPTQAGMVRDTLQAARRRKGERQRQAAPLRFGAAMNDAETAPGGVTVRALLDSCGEDPVGLRDAALFSLAYDAGLRVSELVGTTVADCKQLVDGSGRLTIPYSKTDQDGNGALAWVSPETMQRLSAWLLASGITEGPVFRRINILTTNVDGGGEQLVRHCLGAKALTRQGVVAILRRRTTQAIDLGYVELEPGVEGAMVGSLSAHSFRVGLTQDLFAAGEDGAGIALALRWSSSTTALRYARELAVGSNAAARVLGRLRGGGDSVAS